jgi:hypothetical protein
VSASSLHPPWSDDVARAGAALARFDHATATLADGPLRARLAELRTRVAAVVDAVAMVATEGQRRSLALAGLGPERAAQELKAARRAEAEAPPGTPLASTSAQRVAAAHAQHEVVHRLWDAVEQSAGRLAAFLAQLDGLVARAVELAVLAPSSGAVDAADLDHELDRMAGALDALRHAYDQLDRGAGAPETEGGGP